MSLYVIDTSALVSLGISRVFDELTKRLELHTSEIVVEELDEMTTYDDTFAEAAGRALSETQEARNIEVHPVDSRERRLHPRLDRGESSCINVLKQLNADYLVTDDHRASGALEDYVGEKIVFSPILLKALTIKGIITDSEAVEELRAIAEDRNWYDSPLFEYGLNLFGTE